jgi:Putative Actinobacterial Holin-X, holin superfamily III
MNQVRLDEQMRDSRPLSRVLEDIATNLQEIIKSEIRLGITEVQEKLEVASKPAGILAAGSVAALYGLGFLLLGAVYALSTVVAPWAAALIVGAILLAMAAILVTVARGGFRKVTPPNKTIQSVKENVTWLKDQIR